MVTIKLLPFDIFLLILLWSVSGHATYLFTLLTSGLWSWYTNPRDSDTDSSIFKSRTSPTPS
jgi:hypothetical protein